MVYAEGPNYRFEVDGAIATCRVWRRPDLDSDAGARCAREMTAHFRTLSLAAPTVARAIIMDVREAPAVAGPQTLDALGELMKSWEAVKRPVAVVVGPAPIQALQYRRLVAQHAAHYGGLFSDPDSATRWIEQRSPSSRPGSR